MTQGRDTGATSSQGPRPTLMSRHSVLGWTGMGAATLAVAGASGLTARAVGKGVLTPGQGDAYTYLSFRR